MRFSSITPALSAKGRDTSDVGRRRRRRKRRRRRRRRRRNSSNT